MKVVVSSKREPRAPALIHRSRINKENPSALQSHEMHKGYQGGIQCRLDIDRLVEGFGNTIERFEVLDDGFLRVHIHSITRKMTAAGSIEYQLQSFLMSRHVVEGTECVSSLRFMKNRIVRFISDSAIALEQFDVAGPFEGCRLHIIFQAQVSTNPG
jgi:hypothetical protein